MEVSELVTLRDRLEESIMANINDHLMAFKDKTGVLVSEVDIQFESLETIGERKRALATNVNVKLEL